MARHWLFVCFLTAVFCASPASGTWSIVAVDQSTGEVGSAGASCTDFVAGIVGIQPGHGVIVAQARSNGAARRRGASLLAEGKSPADVVKAIANPDFDQTWEEQQYGVAALRFPNAPAAFTGAKTRHWQGHKIGSAFAVQGNILPGPEVLESMVSAFTSAARKTLAERLLLALEAGSDAGGDTRCGAQRARSSYLVVAKSEDPANAPSLKFIVPAQRTGVNAVTVLREYLKTYVPRPNGRR
jgi:uncharacterized Ntn-hydrolase superfamily protein